MDGTHLSITDFEFLKWSWEYADRLRVPYMVGTTNFSSAFYAKTEDVAPKTIDDRFEANGVEKLIGKDGRPIKTGAFYFYDLFEVRRTFSKLE